MITNCNFSPMSTKVESESAALSNRGDKIYSPLIVLLRVPAVDSVSNYVDIIAFN